MKARVTRKWVRDSYKCIGLGYCAVQNLFSGLNADYYTCGIYGWNMDVYTFGRYAVTTGYRNMIHDYDCENIHEIVSKYESMAEKVRANEIDWDKRQEKLNALIEAFLSEVFGHEIKL